MANPHKGEVDFVVGDRTFKLRLSANEICELEDKLGMGINQISAKLGNAKDMRLGDWRLLLWAALQEHHSEIDLKGAGNLLSDAGLEATVSALGEAMTRTFPVAEKGGDSPSLVTGQAGTGKPS